LLRSRGSVTQAGCCTPDGNLCGVGGSRRLPSASSLLRRASPPHLRSRFSRNCRAIRKEIMPHLSTNAFRYSSLIVPSSLSTVSRRYVLHPDPGSRVHGSSSSIDQMAFSTLAIAAQSSLLVGYLPSGALLLHSQPIAALALSHSLPTLEGPSSSDESISPAGQSGCSRWVGLPEGWCEA